MATVGHVQRWRELKRIALAPAAPLAAYFCMSTMLSFIAPYLIVQRPAYWIFVYIGACALVQLGRVVPRVSAIDLAFAAFIAVIALSWISTGFIGGSRAALLLVSSALIPWCVVRLFTEPDISLFLRVIAVFGGVTTVCYLAAIPFLGDRSAWERVTFEGNVAYGVVGPTVGLLAVMSAIYLMREKLNIAWLMLASSVIAIVHMGARGMLLSLFATVLVACAFVPVHWTRKVKVWSVILCATAIGVAIIPLARMHHFLRLAYDIDAPDRSIDDTIAIRLKLYRQAFELFMEWPLTGVGAGRFGLHTSLNEELTTPHSTIFQVLAELGVLGVIAFAVLNTYLLWLAFRARNRTIGSLVAAAWIYFAIFDQISANYFSTLRYYLFAALLVSVFFFARSKPAVLPGGI